MFFLLLKTKAVFLAGFTIGAVLALLLTLAEDFISDESVCEVGSIEDKLTFITSENLVRDTESSAYEKWLRRQGAKVSRANMDELVYGSEINPTLKNGQKIEADWLKSKIHVTCVVFVDKIKLAESVRDTWAPRCNKIYYFGADKEDEKIPVINFGIKLTSSWQFLCESISHIWREDQERIEWVIFVKDDAMVIPENLRHLVAPLDHEKGYYLGHPVVLWGQAYNVAEAGYVLSREAFSKIAKNFDTREKCAAGGKYWKKEDYYLGQSSSLR